VALRVSALRLLRSSQVAFTELSGAADLLCLRPQTLPSYEPKQGYGIDVNRFVRTIAFVLVAGTLAATAAACGGSNDEPEVAELPAAADTGEPETGATTEASRDPRDILVDFTRCLREEGIDVPDPDFEAAPGEARDRLEEAGIDLDDPQVQEAVQTCQPLLAGILQSFSPEQIQAFRDAFVEYAQCMRDQGIDLPDPDFSGGLDIFGGEIDPSDPAVQAANEVCSEVFGDLTNPFAEP
jgi:hypothetical protein